VLRSLLEAVEEGVVDAVEQFWKVADESGSPLIEPYDDSPDSLWVTFVWREREGVRNVAIFGGPALGSDFENHQLLRLPGTDVWFLSYLVHRDSRFGYLFIPNDFFEPFESPDDVEKRFARARPDPMNPLRLGPDRNVTAETVSVVTLPGAPPNPWIEERSEIPTGSFEVLELDSRHLGGRRKVTAYISSGVSPDVPAAHLLVVFDGHEFLEIVRAPIMLDNLIAEARIPPTVAVFVEHPDFATRDQELQCHEPFTSFVLDELVPWARERYDLPRDPDSVTLAGASYGGLAAACVGLFSRGEVGQVLAQSGTFWWSPPDDEEPSWLVRELAPATSASPRMYISVGRMETPEPMPGVPSQLEVNRALFARMESLGYDVRYHEYEGGHDYVGWAYDFPIGLRTLHEPPRCAPDSLAALRADRPRRPDLVAVVLRSEHALAIVDAECYRIVRTVPTGRGPHEAALDDELRLAFVADYGVFPTPHSGIVESGLPQFVFEPGGTVTVIDLEGDVPPRSIALDACARPHGIAASGDGARVWVTCEESREVIEVAVGDGAVSRRWETAQDVTHIVVVGPTERFLYAASVGSGAVTIIDRESDDVRSFDSGSGAEGLAISPDGRELWVANTTENTITVVDLETAAVVDKMSSGGAFPVKIAFDCEGTEVWVTNNQSDALAVFDRRSRSLIATVPLGTTPLGIDVAPTGEVLVTAPRRNELIILDAVTRRIVRRLRVGIEPDDVLYGSARHSCASSE
jgi:enterochelin esterase family protein